MEQLFYRARCSRTRVQACIRCQQTLGSPNPRDYLRLVQAREIRNRICTCILDCLLPEQENNITLWEPPLFPPTQSSRFITSANIQYPQLDSTWPSPWSNFKSAHRRIYPFPDSGPGLDISDFDRDETLEPLPSSPRD